MPRHQSTARVRSLRRSRTIEDTAAQRCWYLSTFEEHAAAIRGSPANDLALAYQWVLNGGQALRPDTVWKKLTSEEHRNRQSAMERILTRPVDTIDDHLLICFAAHTLLLLHHDAVKHLPDRTICEIDMRTSKLRSEQRRRHPVPQQERSLSIFGAPDPLPAFHQPDDFLCHAIIGDVPNALLASPSSLMGQQFFFPDDNIFYCVSSVETTLDGYRFRIQYEGMRYADTIEFSKMKQMLQSSNTVEV